MWEESGHSGPDAFPCQARGPGRSRSRRRAIFTRLSTAHPARKRRAEPRFGFLDCARDSSLSLLAFDGKNGISALIRGSSPRRTDFFARSIILCGLELNEKQLLSPQFAGLAGTEERPSS
jgi:hypothetical protein